MFDPDSHPDYFIEEPEANEGQNPAGAAQSGEKIVFDGGHDNVSETPGPRRKGRKVIAWIIAVLVTVCGCLIYIRYFNPYVTDAQVSGYVKNVERTGIIFKTYEGELIPDRTIGETSWGDVKPFRFSIPNQEMAKALQNIQNTRKRVKLTYSKYYGVVPWRGATTNELEKAEIEE